jgi:hypothetical protein
MWWTWLVLIGIGMLAIGIFLLVSWFKRRPQGLVRASATADGGAFPVDAVVPEDAPQLMIDQIAKNLDVRQVHRSNDHTKLHRNDELAEHFLLIHRNTFLVKPVPLDRLFDDGKPIIVGGRWLPTPTAYFNSDLAGYNKISKLFGGTFWVYTTGHTVVPLTKTILKEATKRWSKDERKHAAFIPLALTTALQEGEAVLPRDPVKTDVLMDHVYDKVGEHDVIRTSSSPNLKRLAKRLTKVSPP